MPDSDPAVIERSTAETNHVTVALNAQSGSARIVANAQTIRDLVEDTRRAQERGEISLLSGHAV